MKKVDVSDFQANCLAILDKVNRTGQPVTIRKGGKAVAQLVPPVPQTNQYPQQSLIGTVRIQGDIISPILDPDEWEAHEPQK